MDNTGLCECLKTLQNSINFLVIEYCDKLQNGQCEQNQFSQLSFIDSFFTKVFSNIQSIVKLLKCSLASAQTPQNFNSAETKLQLDRMQRQLDEKIYNAMNQKPMVNTPQVYNLNQSIFQKSVLSDDLSTSASMMNQQQFIDSKFTRVSREEQTKFIYEQYKLFYDPNKRNKYQITSYLADLTGWSVSTIANMIKKNESQTKQNSNEYSEFSSMQEQANQYFSFRDTPKSFEQKTEKKLLIKRDFNQYAHQDSRYQQESTGSPSQSNKSNSSENQSNEDNRYQIKSEHKENTNIENRDEQEEQHQEQEQQEDIDNELFSNNMQAYQGPSKKLQRE